MLKADIRAAIVAKANRAPSVHNTQCARWAFDGDGVQIYADESRLLKIGDPSLQDAGVSCGAALEGTIMALAEESIGVASIEDHWVSDEPSAYPGMKRAAHLTLKLGARADALSAYVEDRFTWRGLFTPSSDEAKESLMTWSEGLSDLTLVTQPDAIAKLAEINDTASLKFFQNRPYREELLSYMRLSGKHPLWDVDGLNRESMQLSKFEGFAAGMILRFPIFEGVNKLGLGKAIVTEAAKTKSATAIALFTKPADMSPVQIGRDLYRRWLELTELGFSVWPMAVVADDPQSAAHCRSEFDIPSGDKIINVLRIGSVHSGTTVLAARLSPTDLILERL